MWCRLLITILLTIVVSWGIVFLDAGNLYSSEAVKREMILIPAGEFIAGSDNNTDGKRGVDFGVAEEPRHKVYLKAFYIDKYEVTVGEYREYLKAKTKEWLGDIRLPKEMPAIYSEPERLNRHPASYVPWADADDYCKWVGKRLPTEYEWEKAARGKDGRQWSWGNKYEIGKAHTSEAGIKGTVTAGSYPEDISPYGVYDMVGNVHEWTASHFLPYPGNTINDGRYSKDVYVLKGGSFLMTGIVFARVAARSSSRPDYSHRTYGFRCAKDAD